MSGNFVVLVVHVHPNRLIVIGSRGMQTVLPRLSLRNCSLLFSLPFSAMQALPSM